LAEKLLLKCHPVITVVEYVVGVGADYDFTVVEFDIA
jgi:hypothetical protein